MLLRVVEELLVDEQHLGDAFFSVGDVADADADADVVNCLGLEPKLDTVCGRSPEMESDL